EQEKELQKGAETVALDQPIGRLSRMDSLTNQGITMNALNKARTRRARLEQAVKRLDEEDFGICVECGEPIAVKRLLALPETTLCIECAE
ncbi:MAG: TraR/DksA family transcriptional regulator, partial [Desulfovibrionales bacterium]